MQKFVWIGLVIALVAVFTFVPEARRLFTKPFTDPELEMLETGGSQAGLADVTKVYITRVAGDQYYHAYKECPQIRGLTVVPRPLEEARQLYEPCPVCRPPTEENAS